jgi:uncharacterized protein (DUF1810 family)
MSRPVSRLERFRDAQDSPHAGFEMALGEIRSGGKRGHWIWYVFPQISGLGESVFSRTFAIEDEDEAVEFLRDPDLRSRLLTITTAVAEQLRQGTPVRTLMGSEIDAIKLVSSLTLFECVARKLSERERAEPYASLAVVAEEVLAVAASQGHARCAHTLRRLGQR